MADASEVYAEMKSFLDFNDADVQNLITLAPIFAKHGGAITDAFYETLGQYPTTAALIEGRVDHLKATHAAWMRELVAGDYGDAYLARRMRIGEVHVRIGLPPYYVEAVMNNIRVGGHAAITTELSDAADIDAKYGSLVKILDLDLLIINLAYSEERLDRMSAITGMSRKLVERLITKAKKD